MPIFHKESEVFCTWFSASFAVLSSSSFPSLKLTLFLPSADCTCAWPACTGGSCTVLTYWGLTLLDCSWWIKDSTCSYRVRDKYSILCIVLIYIMHYYFSCVYCYCNISLYILFILALYLSLCTSMSSMRWWTLSSEVPGPRTTSTCNSTLVSSSGSLAASTTLLLHSASPFWRGPQSCPGVPSSAPAVYHTWHLTNKS